MSTDRFKLRPVAQWMRRRRRLPIGLSAFMSLPGVALAGPNGEQLVAGAATVHRPDPNRTHIDQSTHHAVINWSGFDVGEDEFVVFRQPGVNASILNRVVGGQESAILGQINANGRVYLVNPQGIYFAPGAKVDVGALTASALDITDDDFMSGSYVFNRPPTAPAGAQVVNAGDIQVTAGGYVVLAGDYVRNSGVITARLGEVVLAAGSRITLDLGDDGLLSFAVDEGTVSALAGVDNSGAIIADGGRVIMTAKIANDLSATAVNNDGLVQARRIVEDGGEIYLAASGGSVVNSGQVDVSASEDFDGGRVAMNASADITLTETSTIKADGAGHGSGGRVDVIADGTLAFRHDAEVSAIAGEQGARGGEVELSGHGGLELHGDVSIGSGGSITIDPAVITISDGTMGSSPGSTIGTKFIESQLNSNVDVTLAASSSITRTPSATTIVATGTGDLVFSVIGSLGGDIKLAGLDINIVGNLTATAGSISGGDIEFGSITAANVDLDTGPTNGDIVVSSGGINVNGNFLNLAAPNGNVIIGTPATNGDVNVNGSIVNVDISAGLDVNIHGDIGIGALSGANLNVAGRNIIAGDVDVGTPIGGASIQFVGTNDVAIADISTQIQGTTTVLLDAGNNLTTNRINTNTQSGNVVNTLLAGNNIAINGATQVRAGVVASGNIDFVIDAANRVTINDTLSATGLSDSGVDIAITGAQGVVIHAPISATANTTAGPDVAIDINAMNGDIVVDELLLARSSPTDPASVVLDAGPTGNIFVNGGITTIGGLAGIGLYGKNISVNEPVAIDADTNAIVDVSAVNNLNVPANVTINGANADVVFGYGGAGIFGRQTILSPGGDARAHYGSSPTAAARSARFDKPILVGGATSKIAVAVENSIQTANAGILDADELQLITTGAGPASIVATTKSPLITLTGTTSAPHLSLNNQAFPDPSTIDFGAFVRVKTAELFSVNSLRLTGNLVADRLNIGVMNGVSILDGSINITGFDPFPVTPPDLALFEVLTRHGLNPPLHGASAQIFAEKGIVLNGTMRVGGPTPFTKMFTNGPFNISGLHSATDNILSVFSPLDTTRAVFFEDRPFIPPLDASALFNFPTIKGFANNAGTTVVIGEMGPVAPVLSGPFTIASRGPIDIGARNLFVLSRGARATDAEFVTTTGIFEIIGVASANFFETPTVDEFGDDSDTDEQEREDDLAMEERDGAASSDDTDISRNSGASAMECS